MSRKLEKDEKPATVSIPIQLYDKIKKRLGKTGFTSVSDYVTYVLREILASLEEEEVFTKEEEEKVKERLRALGYLD
ncbi:MAG: CopG family transcriptional regulator [Promethearchaeota archaeon]